MKHFNHSATIFHCLITFFSHKRRMPPVLDSKDYRPHFVIQGQSEYLGVCFIDGEKVVFDQAVLCSALPLYDGVDYSVLKKGVQFSVMEGANKVGIGVIEEVVWYG